MGKAYGFLNCKASKDKIEKFLPNIKEKIKIPSTLELFVVKGINNIFRVIEEKTDSEGEKDYELKELYEFILGDYSPERCKGSRKSRLRCLIEATCPDTTNKETAEELIKLINGINQTPSLYKPEEILEGVVFYKKGNGYYDSFTLKSPI